MMALIVLVSATFIYFFEDRNNIPSMPHALWLAVVTMTTVGYGHVNWQRRLMNMPRGTRTWKGNMSKQGKPIGLRGLRVEHR